MASGARTLVGNAGAVFSLAFATDGHERHAREHHAQDVLWGLKRALRRGGGTFIAGFHAAFLFMVGASLAGAVFSALWGSEERGVSST